MSAVLIGETINQIKSNIAKLHFSKFVVVRNDNKFNGNIVNTQKVQINNKL